MGKETGKQYQITVAEKQFRIIKKAVEIYGKIQTNRFHALAEVMADSVYRSKPAHRIHWINLRDRLELQIKQTMDFARKDAFPENNIFQRPSEAAVALDILEALENLRNEELPEIGGEPAIKVERLS